METKAEVWIPLTQGKVAVIDFEDFEKVRGLKWRAIKDKHTWYAVAHGKRVNGTRPFLRMHRTVMEALPGEQVDHKDGDGLNNRRGSNLRMSTHQQNMFNRRHREEASSHFKGVYRHTQARRWCAKIGHNKKAYFLGIFATEEAAAHAYDAAAIKYYGEHAAPNFPNQNQCQSLISDGVSP